MRVSEMEVPTTEKYPKYPYVKYWLKNMKRILPLIAAEFILSFLGASRVLVCVPTVKRHFEAVF